MYLFCPICRSIAVWSVNFVPFLNEMGLDFKPDLLWSNGATAGLNLGQSMLIQVSSLCSLTKIGLGLTELGQVHSSNLLCFLNLFLVRLDLALKLVHEGLHPLVILPVLISCVSQLLDPPLSSPQVLLGICEAPIFSLQFRFQLPDPGLHLVDCLLASLQSIGFSLS